MDVGEALGFVRHNSRAVLATMRRDGGPQLSPVTVAVQDGRAVVSSRETAVKVCNLRRDPRAWLCVFPDAFYGTWVQLEGTVRLVSLPAAMDGLVSYYRTLSGEHPDWEDYRAAMVRDRRCLIELVSTRAGPDVSG